MDFTSGFGIFFANRRAGPSGSRKKTSSKGRRECAGTEAPHFAVPAPSKAPFSECSCLQAFALMSFNCSLKVLTQVHTQGSQFQAGCSHFAAKDVPTPSKSLGRVQNAACYLLLLFVLVKLSSGLEEISWGALFTPPPCCK